MKRFAYLAIVAVCLPSAGCGDGPEEATAGITVFEVRGTVRAFGSDAPIGGVELCPIEIEGYDCVTTGDDGRFTIDFPADSDSFLSAAHPDYPPHLMHLKPVGGRPFEPLMVSQAQLDAAMSEAGGAADPARGHLLAVFDNGENRLNGVALSSSNGDHGDPIYYNGLGDPDAEATATSGAGAALLPNLRADEVTSIFGNHPERECAVPSRSQNSDGGVPFYFEAGTVSVSDTWECELPSGGGETSGG